MPRTGEKCKKLGIYDADCSCKKRVTLDRGEQFPKCPGCGWVVEWTLSG